MTYRIPNEDRLAEAVFVVMYRNPQVRSQTAMAELVRKELYKDDEEFRVSGERIRRIVIERNILDIAIEYHDSNDQSVPEKCPVCGDKLRPILNGTLDGGVAEVGRSCIRCPYSMGTSKKIPGRYTFTKGSRK